MSTSTTTPISPTRFAAALKDLSLSMLHLKVLELRNSIAHLDYSNEQLRPFADGTAPPTSVASGTPPQPDQDCADAIAENEGVIARMQERIQLIRAEVEERGCSWAEFQSKEEVEEEQEAARRRRERGEAGLVNGASGRDGAVNGEGTRDGGGASGNGESGRTTHSAWTDGTFQTGTISNGEVRMDAVPGREAGGGGSLTDEELRRRLEEQMGSLEEEDEEGVHL